MDETIFHSYKNAIIAANINRLAKKEKQHKQIASLYNLRREPNNALSKEIT